MSTHAATHLPLASQHLRERTLLWPFLSLVYHHYRHPLPLLVFKEPPLSVTHHHPNLWARARKPTINSTKSPRNPKPRNTHTHTHSALHPTEGRLRPEGKAPAPQAWARTKPEILTCFAERLLPSRSSKRNESFLGQLQERERPFRFSVPHGTAEGHRCRQQYVRHFLIININRSLK